MIGPLLFGEIRATWSVAMVAADCFVFVGEFDWETHQANRLLARSPSILGVNSGLMRTLNGCF